MLWHEFIFSNQSRHSTPRHLAGWLLWWLYVVFTIFYSQKIPNSFFHYQPGLNELGYGLYSLLVIIKSFLLLLTHFCFCYATIYILLPDYLSKKKYGHLVAGLLILCTLTVPLGYFLYSVAYPFVDSVFGIHVTQPNKTIVWASIDAGLLYAIKLTLIAVAIILLKRWWLKQKEKERLEKEKVNAELQLLKAQIHPAFLFSTLTNIMAHAKEASPKAPGMLIKLSDLLSYMLYECDEPKVKLEKEISMLKDYMALEKIRQGERVEMTFQLNGKLNGQLISPLLLLPFIDNSFSYCNHALVEQAWVNLDITLEGNNLSMKLINGLPSILTMTPPEEEQQLANVQKRLQLLYPGRHELKINADQELLLVHLNLTLEEATGEDQITAATKTDLRHAGV
jgi:sensor histidine kinase YesM